MALITAQSAVLAHSLIGEINGYRLKDDPRCIYIRIDIDAAVSSVQHSRSFWSLCPTKVWQIGKGLATPAPGITLPHF